MITILSDNGRFKAVLDDADDGVTVTFWRRTAGPTSDKPVWSMICRQTLDVAFHIVRDLAHDTVNELVEPTSWPTPAQKRARALHHSLKSRR
jgi:hypothetical protein